MQAKSMDTISWIGDTNYDFIYTISEQGEDGELNKKINDRPISRSKKHKSARCNTIQNARKIYTDRECDKSRFSLSCLEYHGDYLSEVLYGHGLSSKVN